MNINRCILIIFLSLFCNLLHAQDFHIAPSLDIAAKGYCTDEQIIAEGKFTNTSHNKKTYQWYRLKNKLPTNWFVTTCVPGKCYSAEKDSGVFVLDKGKTGILDQNFFPSNSPGTAIIEFFVYEKNKRNTAVKVIFYVEAKEKFTK